MNDHEELGKNIKKLLAILKRIMSQDGGGAFKGNLPPELQQILTDNKNIQLNLCVFAFLPFGMDDMEDMEDAFDLLDDENDSQGKDPSLAYEITPSDVDFLKKYGIKF